MESFSLENVSFLVVDDNVHMRRLIRTVLRSLGALQVWEASDGADALKQMGTISPDVVICDWMMTPIDGIEFARMVRTSADSPNPFIPIIMLTGHSEAHRVREARDTGANTFLVKPISAKRLYQAVHHIINRPRPFIRTATYFGPDRRTNENPNYNGPERRKDKK